MKEIIDCWLPEKKKQRTCLTLYGWSRFLYFEVLKWHISARRFLSCNPLGYYLWVFIVVNFLSFYNDDMKSSKFQVSFIFICRFLIKKCITNLFLSENNIYFIKIFNTSKYNVLYSLMQFQRQDKYLAKLTKLRRVVSINWITERQTKKTFPYNLH